jgi:hypothetical protein
MVLQDVVGDVSVDIVTLQWLLFAYRTWSLCWISLYALDPLITLPVQYVR